LKTLFQTFIAIILGFAVGMLLSEFMGIVGFLWLGKAIGIKYFAIYSAILFGLVSLIWQVKIIQWK
jgi:putative Ca2+/H+ antiporter (TMEM165/GDT1 family)